MIHQIDDNTPQAQATYAEAYELFKSLNLDMKNWSERNLFAKMVSVARAEDLFRSEHPGQRVTRDAVLDYMFEKQRGYKPLPF